MSKGGGGLRKRNLKKNDNNEDMKRMVVKCPPTMSQENCLEQLRSSGESVTLVHNLASRHSIAIQADSSTGDDLKNMGLSVTEDYPREPLYLPESLKHYERNLGAEEVQQPQQIPYGVELIKATQVWENYGAQGQGVKVCIMDTGLYEDHPDFTRVRLDGSYDPQPWNVDLQGHGTHTTGVLAATDNNVGIVGVAPLVDVYMVRVFRDNGKFYGSDVVAAAEACRQAGTHIISMSLGGFGYVADEHDIFDELYNQDGILAVAAAGNSGGPERTYPAAYDSVIGVAACDQDKKIAQFSTFNSFVDVSAPGVDILSTWIDGGYVSLSGTSMATPFVTGVLALMKSYRPNATPDELKLALLGYTQESSENNPVALGVVDAMAAISALDAGFFADLQRTCIVTDLTVHTDQYGKETAYRLRRASGGKAIWRGVGLLNNKEYFETSCLEPNDCYEFMIKDSYGDGILGEGNGIRITYGSRVLFEGGQFGYGGSLRFGDTC